MVRRKLTARILTFTVKLTLLGIPRLSTLQSMSASSEIDAEQARDLLLDLELSYSDFNGYLDKN